ncbi:hypothetical protein BJ973_008413 [Actinoplanes tereljensis]|uniref:Uncharacterized protein n=1 Tax=Paractinoplanes tereljensis TaxID=571912 RepID=A0A919NI52_9ACTN|nr:hypothetical protein [Actinoplanes tereljensis]GIF18628.1 hypothetical protein Ate02nite_13580 [Actinoplanes tereljensis]
MSMHGVLFRIYRPIIIPFAVILVTVDLSITALIVGGNGEIGFSMWLVLAGSAAKYWLLVVGIMLVVMQLRVFVANGRTRREFLAGAGVFGLIASVTFAAIVVLGHGLEGVVLEAVGGRGDGYPVLSVGGMLGEFGQVFPETIAYMISGALVAAGFYRWRPWIGVVVMVGGAIPALVADGLLGIDEFGVMVARLPYPAALALSLAATALAGLAFHRVISGVAIRRTAG